MNTFKTTTSHDSNDGAVKLKTKQANHGAGGSTKLLTRKQSTSSSAGRLNASEDMQFRACEDTIRQGWGTFLAVGEALQTIRDGRLYRDEYGTFDAYCTECWGYGRAHAYRYIEAAEVVKDLSLPLSPKGDKTQ